MIIFIIYIGKNVQLLIIFSHYSIFYIMIKTSLKRVSVHDIVHLTVIKLINNKLYYDALHIVFKWPYIFVAIAK